MNGQTQEQAIYFFDTLPSTNDKARELAENGTAAGTVVIAAQQTKGRGRMGRSFYSPSGAGLYMSIVLRPALSPEYALSITAASAVSVRRAICALFEGISEIKIKWVNDLLLGGKKICGILAESGPLTYAEDGSARFSHVVVGIGINLSEQESLPEELSKVACSLGLSQEEADAKRQLLAEEIRKELLFLLAQMEEREKVQLPPFSDDFISYYNDHAAMRGKTITVTEGAKSYSAFAEAIDAYGHLRIIKNGTEHLLKTGEITVRIT